MIKGRPGEERAYVPAGGHAWSIVEDKVPALTQGSRVSVNGVSEEAPYDGILDEQGNPRNYTATEFNNVLQWAIAHELLHLLIRVQTGPGWDDQYHLSIPGSVTRGPVRRVDGISGVQFNGLECKAINLPCRASVAR